MLTVENQFSCALGNLNKAIYVDNIACIIKNLLTMMLRSLPELCDNIIPSLKATKQTKQGKCKELLVEKYKKHK